MFLCFLCYFYHKYFKNTHQHSYSKDSWNNEVFYLEEDENFIFSSVKTNLNWRHVIHILYSIFLNTLDHNIIVVDALHMTEIKSKSLNCLLAAPASDTEKASEWCMEKY